jgi:hypothetical protein
MRRREEPRGNGAAGDGAAGRKEFAMKRQRRNVTGTSAGASWLSVDRCSEEAGAGGAPREEEETDRASGRLPEEDDGGALREEAGSGKPGRCARLADAERGRALEALACRMQRARRRVRIWRRVVVRLQHDWEHAGQGAPSELRLLMHLAAAQSAYVEALQEQHRARAAWRATWGPVEEPAAHGSPPSVGTGACFGGERRAESGALREAAGETPGAG